jgi:hypothetical protein
MRNAKKDTRSVPNPVWTGNRKPMRQSDFRIGCEFLSGNGRWRCTDVGTRIIAAIKLNHDDDPSWYNGPPYKVVEQVFDEYDIEGCEKAPRQRGYDDSGRAEIVTVSRKSSSGRRPVKKSRTRSL